MHAIQLICWQSEGCFFLLSKHAIKYCVTLRQMPIHGLNPTKSTMAETVHLVWCRADVPLCCTRCVLLASSEKLAPQVMLLCVIDTPACSDTAQILRTCCAADIVARCAACMYVRSLAGHFSCSINKLHVNDSISREQWSIADRQSHHYTQHVVIRQGQCRCRQSGVALHAIEGG
jgi:hypothetical protein